MELGCLPLRASNEYFPSSATFQRSGKAALDCAHRTSTVSSCAFCEQGGHLAAPSLLLRPRVARARKNTQLHPCSCFFNNSFTFPGFAFPPARLHHLPHEEAQTCCLPSLNCATCAGFFFKDFFDDLHQRLFVRDLRQPFFLHDLLGSLSHAIEFRKDFPGDFKLIVPCPPSAATRPTVQA